MQIKGLIFRRLIIPALCSVLALALTTIAGCAATQKAFESLQLKLRYGEDTASLQKGFSACEKGKFTEAVGILQNLYDNSGSLTVRRQALYGLAVCRLTEAQTPEAFHNAHLLWQGWRQSRVVRSECEDPVYLEPFLMCKFPSESQAVGKSLITDACTEKVPRYQYEESEKRSRQLEINIKTLEEKNQALTAENEDLVRIQNDKDALIKVLKEKIKALEDIDQKIQQKKQKTEISAPE
jgi:hypothetical protein